MGSKCNALENRLIDGLFRGGALAAGGTLNSSAVATGVWTATTAYALGDIVIPHANMTGAGGKFLLCTTAGTSGSTNTLAVPAVGSTLTDSTVTWTAISGVPAPLTAYVALIRATAGVSPRSTAVTVGQTTVPATPNGRMYRCTTAGTTGSGEPTWGTTDGGTTSDGTAVWTDMVPDFEAFNSNVTSVEVSAGGYARVALTLSLANMAGTQAAASTTASTGTGGTTSNNNAITFGAPSANWGVIGAAMLVSLASGGIGYTYGVLSTPKTVNNGDPAPSFAAAALTYQEDN